MLENVAHNIANGMLNVVRERRATVRPPVSGIHSMIAPLLCNVLCQGQCQTLLGNISPYRLETSARARERLACYDVRRACWPSILGWRAARPLELQALSSCPRAPPWLPKRPGAPHPLCLNCLVPSSHSCARWPGFPRQLQDGQRHHNKCMVLRPH